MPDIIRLLSDHLANQIAAGEVIQRPASAVKELLENAIDAGATELQLHLRDAGKELIQVIDNGSGMSPTDARMAFERHATSKIRDIDDLFRIRTMGFRGEALASIAAVAQVELRTKREHDEVGTCIEIENSIVKAQQPVATPTGTSIAMTWKPSSEATSPQITWSASAGSVTACASEKVKSDSRPPKTDW